MTKAQQLMKKAQKRGLTPLDMAKMHEVARASAKKMEQEAIEKAWLWMLAIPLNILVNDYWPKSARKKAPKFIEDVISLFESVQAGVVSNEELASLLYDYAGVKIEADWLHKESEGERMIIYLSGPITGVSNYREKFEKAAEKWSGGGNKIINPAALDEVLHDGATWGDYMSICMRLLDMAEAVVLLKGWEGSRGANREYGYALAKDLIILEE